MVNPVVQMKRKLMASPMTTQSFIREAALCMMTVLPHLRPVGTAAAACGNRRFFRHHPQPGEIPRRHLHRPMRIPDGHPVFQGGEEVNGNSALVLIPNRPKTTFRKNPISDTFQLVLGGGKIFTTGHRQNFYSKKFRLI